MSVDMILFVREEQADLMKRLSDLESKVIVGGVNLVSVNFVILYVTLLSSLFMPSLVVCDNNVIYCYIWTLLAWRGWKTREVVGKIKERFRKEKEKGVYVERTA